MTAIQKPFNLLFSLPDELITEIYSTFDPTYRIFHTLDFRDELFRNDLVSAGWLNINKKTIKEDIHEHILMLITETSVDFVNEYGYFGDFKKIKADKKKVRTILKHPERSGKNKIVLVKYKQNNFEIYLHRASNNFMYYKILPKGSTKENCAFLRNPQLFDGFMGHNYCDFDSLNPDDINFESEDCVERYEKVVAAWERKHDIACANLLNKQANPDCDYSEDGFIIYI
jgi:hypothetical protein